MASETSKYLEAILSRLPTKRTWGLSIGPAGVHLHFGELHHDPNPKAKPHGDLSIWVKGAIEVTNKAKVFWSSGPCPDESEAAKLSVLVCEKVVSQATVDWNKNALRLILSEELLFSAYPVQVNKDHFPWIVYDHLGLHPHYVVVNENELEVF